MLGIVNNKVHATSLEEMVEKSRLVGEKIDVGDYEGALELRGHSFEEQLKLLEILSQSEPLTDLERGNILVVTAGHDSPGMNACVRVLTRLALDTGFQVFGATYGFEGLLEGDIRQLGWMDVSGWTARGGSDLGAGRLELGRDDLRTLAQVLEEHDISALVLIGGMDAYQNAEKLKEISADTPALQIPIVVVPASINNNLPGTDFSLGADTALNNIIVDVDKIKDTAGANKRAFIIEVFGYDSGYLALMACIASGAEQVYLPEEGVTLQQLVDDVEMLRSGFERGKRLSLIILNERASPVYNLDLIQRIMEEEGGELFDVRSVVLGHTQLGGSPSPFDRILAARFGAAVVDALLTLEGNDECLCIGLRGKYIVTTELVEAMNEIAWPKERQRDEWFMDLYELAHVL